MISSRPLWILVFFLWLVLQIQAGIVVAAANKNHHHIRDGQVSYVIEPFESIVTTTTTTIKDNANNDDDDTTTTNDWWWWFSSSIYNRTLVPGLFGKHALQVDYSFWEEVVEFKWQQRPGQALHNCHHAKTISLWYQHHSSSSSITTTNTNTTTNDNTENNILLFLRVSLINERNISIPIVQQRLLLPTQEEEEEEWKELVISTLDLPRNVNLRRIQGWKIELQRIPPKKGNTTSTTTTTTTTTTNTTTTPPRRNDNTTNTTNTTTGQRRRKMQTQQSQSQQQQSQQSQQSQQFTFRVDQLACHGGGDLLGSSFVIGNQYTLNQSLQEEFWRDTYYQSNISKAQTNASLFNPGGILDIEYTLEQVESWGGFVDFAHLAPGNAYYNISSSSSSLSSLPALSLDYTIVQPASIPGRAIFRLVLQDNSHCNVTTTTTTTTSSSSSSLCSSDYHSHERYYSFHSILDHDNDTSSSSSGRRSGTLIIPLQASTEPSTDVPFWLTGWSGILGNRILDMDQLKGFTLELVLDSQLELGELVTGHVQFSNFQAVNLYNDNNDNSDNNHDDNINNNYDDAMWKSEVSYVMEPFETIYNDQWFQNPPLALNISKEDALFGKGALHVDYSFSDNNHNNNNNNKKVSFGWLHETRTHNCYGAETFSIWYKRPIGNAINTTTNTTTSTNNNTNDLEPQPPQPRPPQDRLRLILVDARDVSYVVLDRNIMSNDNNNDEWHPLIVSATAFHIDLRRIKGWMIELVSNDDDDDNNNNNNSNQQQQQRSLLLDQLACNGNGDLMGSFFHVGETNFSITLEKRNWMDTYYQSNISKDETSSAMIDGGHTLAVNYTIEQVESWGGFVDFAFLAPGSSYYNVSKATDLILNYTIGIPSSEPGRAIFRLVLQDNSHCNVTCDTDYHSHERYYSFNSILDISADNETQQQQQQQQLVVPFIASTEPSTPFWLTGWSGILGNSELDITELKGFTFEFVLDSQLEMGSLVTGSVSMSDFASIYVEPEDPVANSQVSYVMEPFESMNTDEWTQYISSEETRLNMTISSEDFLFGENALRVEYSLHQKDDYVQFGWIQSRRPHNCFGAESFSIWFKLLTNGLEQTHNTDRMRVSMVTDGGTSIVIFDEALSRAVDEAQWKEITVSTDLFEMDLRRLQGWTVEVVKAHQSADSANTTSSSDHVILLDQLACNGRGNMLGSVFHLGNLSLDMSIEEGTWMDSYYQSNISAAETFSSMNDGVLALNYTIEQVESWGGFVDFAHLAPGSSYYNLSKASELILDYDILIPSSAPGRAIFRLVLQDNSDCNVTCDTDYHSHERYYSFHSILDFDSDDTRKGQLAIPLVASTEPSTPFWLTGWSGITGNSELDLSELKGFTFEFVLDSQLEMGSIVTGSVLMSGFSAAYVEAEDANTDEPSRCVSESESGLQFLVNREKVPGSTTGFTRIEFLGNLCCDICAEDPDCNYALSTGRDCFTASSLEPEDVDLLASEIEIADYKSYWMDDAAKRGDFCDLCECRKSERLIDCRNRDLKIVPKTFKEEDWVPLTLDLRENPKLVMLGSDALSSIGENLEDLWIPIQMVHISKDSLRGLKKLHTIHFEGDPNNRHRLTNAIKEPSGMFGDICCSRGERIELLDSGSSLTFCDMHVDRPGVDSIYEPFIERIGTSIAVLFPSSSFMSEAAETVEKCAEYCTISTDCRYFSYDARLPNAEHSCALLKDSNGGSERVCCDDDHYADANRTIPGRFAGLPPRTRHENYKAAVIVEPRNLAVTTDNGFQTNYELSLGSAPLRGAVWITPEVVASEETHNVTIWPPKIVLYDENMTATISVSLFGIGPEANRSTLVIRNSVVSCDAAFEWQTTESTTVFVNIDPPYIEEKTDYTVAIVVPIVLIVAIGFILFLFYERQRRKNDSIWKVSMAELNFPDPPQVIGRGTFGLVLLAEYRGTQCAVKRAIPPMKRKKSGSGRFFDSSIGTSFDSTSNDNDPDMDIDLTLGAQSTNTSNQNASNMKKSGSYSKSGMASLRTGTASGLLNFDTSSGTRLLSDAAVYKQMKADFITEMRYLSKLRHPCITTVMGAVMEKNVEPMLVMEYMDHGSLYDLLQNETMILEPDMIIMILRDITQGVRFLHSAIPQVVHGDLKAANILVDGKFRAKVSDFGLTGKSTKGATGTPFWMAPELLRGESKNTAASDIYSIGMIVYEVYSRRDPYEDEDPNEVIRLVADKNVNKRPPVPLSCPEAVQVLMKDCLHEDPAQRPTSEELDTRLRRIEVKNVVPEAPKSAISLFDIFPRHIAEALSEGRKVEAEHKDVVTIFFSDIVGFTNISSTLPPRKVADMLDRLYHAFDDLATKHDVFKVETIGDAYMAVTNLVKDQPDDHAKRIAEFAIDALVAANTIQIDLDDPDSGFVNIRVGFHSGPVVADVVGNRNPRYCLFGDTVNTASRMESNSKVNRIHCSEKSAEILMVQCPDLPLASRGHINIKGKGEMHTFWVNEKNQKRITLTEKELLKWIPRSSSVMKTIEDESSLSLPKWDEHKVNVSEDFVSKLKKSYFSGEASSAKLQATTAPQNEIKEKEDAEAV